MFIKEVEWCSIENWYPLFKKVTFKTIILPIPNEVLEYLRSDGSLILPQECTEDENTEDEIEGEKDGSGTENENNQQENPTFPHFNAQVQDALERLGGKVFPKLNWSAPKDAKWMGFGNSLQCESLSQIWLLLKSSEFITHDLTQPFKDCSDDDTSSAYENVASNVNYVLALKKWSSTINPATEFRCYIKSKKMFAIEQRWVLGNLEVRLHLFKSHALAYLIKKFFLNFGNLVANIKFPKSIIQISSQFENITHSTIILD